MSLFAESQQQLDDWIRHYQQQGFGLTDYRPGWAVLVRGKRMTQGWLIFWIVFGILFLWIPLIVYLILFALATDVVITIQVGSPVPQTDEGRSTSPSHLAAGAAAAGVIAGLSGGC